MVDSSIVLWGQTLAYTFYVLAILALMGWFAWRVTQPGESHDVKPALFYSFVAFLVVLGVSLHFITYYTIPWKPMDLHLSLIHISEPTRLGMISYAVFCLKKKK